MIAEDFTKEATAMGWVTSEDYSNLYYANKALQRKYDRLSDIVFCSVAGFCSGAFIGAVLCNIGIL